jgi:hypothetical protein
MSSRIAVALIFTAWLAATTLADDRRDSAGMPAACTEKVALTPDLCQTDEAFRATPYGGMSSCGPTSFANVLIAMDRHGFGNLVAGDVCSRRSQRALIEQLLARGYLHVNKSGIGPYAAMKGIERFVRERGYDARLEWQGWRHGGPYATRGTVDTDWLRKGVIGTSNVVINLGWYCYDRDEDLYTRIGGHYMTLVGYRQKGNGFVYLIHDPAPRSGPGKVTHEARLVPIRSGRMAPWKQYGERAATGHCRIEGILVQRTADLALLDGAIRLAIAKPP